MMLLFLMLLNFSYASDQWKIGQKSLQLTNCPEKYCYYYCPKKDCRALEVLKNPQKAILTENGKNPGSEVCTSLKGHVSIASNNKGDQLSLCRFSDDSILSLDGLWVW